MASTLEALSLLCVPALVADALRLSLLCRVLLPVTGGKPPSLALQPRHPGPWTRVPVSIISTITKLKGISLLLRLC